MKYNVLGSVMPAVEITLNAGEELVSEKGGMSWQSDGITMSTNTNGGLLKGLGRMFGGESLFMNTYSATRDNSVIAFSGSFPGRVLPINLSDVHNGLIAQKGAFLCSEKSVNLNVAFTKRFSAGLFGGEGFILQDISGTGTVFLEVDGDLVEKELAPNEVFKINTGNIVCFEKSVQYSVETVKGFSNILFGGEGLFLTKLVGPGKIVLQTGNFNDLAGRILAMMPPSSNN